MNAVASLGASRERFQTSVPGRSWMGGPEKRSVGSVFAPLTRLAAQNPRGVTMQQPKPITIHMTILIPFKIRALAHRRMALSALRANSSLSVRLKRYNHHMSQVRALESQGGAE